MAAHWRNIMMVPSTIGEQTVSERREMVMSKCGIAGRIVRAAAMAVLLLSGLIRGAGAAPTDMPELAKTPISGVALDGLAAIRMQKFRHHLDGLELSRIEFACGETTGLESGADQLFFVEWGRVEVRDWETDEVIAELTAGDAYGGDEHQVYLFANNGKDGSVLQFRAGGVVGSSDPESQYKDVTYTSTDCASGSSTEKSARPANETVLVRYPDAEKPTVPANDYTMFVGLLILQPGAALGSLDRTPEYVSNGPLVVLPLLGGFGDGEELPGIAVGDFGPARPAVIAHGSGSAIALENAASF